MRTILRGSLKLPEMSVKMLNYLICLLKYIIKIKLIFCILNI